MGIELAGYNTQRGKLQFVEKNLSYCRFIHYKFRSHNPEIESGYPQ